MIPYRCTRDFSPISALQRVTLFSRALDLASNIRCLHNNLPSSQGLLRGRAGLPLRFCSACFAVTCIEEQAPFRRFTIHPRRQRFVIECTDL